MQVKARLYEMKIFGKNNTKKAIFLDADTMDKIDCLLSDEEYNALLPNKGKDGVLTVGLIKEEYAYKVKYKSFKVN